MSTSGRATSERRPVRRARAVPQAMLSLTTKRVEVTPAARTHEYSGAWTCLLSLLLMTILLAVGVTASVFVFGSSHQP